MKTIIFSKTAAKQFDQLPMDAQTRVLDALTLYATIGQGDVTALSARGGYRLRVGPYRVIFDEILTAIVAVQISRRTTTTYR